MPDLSNNFAEQALDDYRLAVRSREMSLAARREVLSGRAKFGGFGGGKELPLLAMARFFMPGDFRSGYYRDQTLLLALGALSISDFFAQLYAFADGDAEPNSSGRQMPAHFATHSLAKDGRWLDLANQINSAADLSPTGSQMPRLVGLAQASKLYRHLPDLPDAERFSLQGREVAFGIIGNASCAEGMFWESINAIGVLQVPAVVTIMDDDYGISVHNRHQITKESISQLLQGFASTADRPGFNLFTVRGWDYPALLKVYEAAVADARKHHQPAIIHVTELTQPQGHSTSGSHERYKSAERLKWEKEFDCVHQMRRWLLDEELAHREQLADIEAAEQRYVRAEVMAIWESYKSAINRLWPVPRELLLAFAADLPNAIADQIRESISQIEAAGVPRRKPFVEAAFHALRLTQSADFIGLPTRHAILKWYDSELPKMRHLYSSHISSLSADSPLAAITSEPIYGESPPEEAPGYELLNRYFKHLFAHRPEVVTFGEDVGFLGGVNQTMSGLQALFGELRISDTGIRETTIVGQAIGLAMRGLRPIAEIQYLDYLPYALQIIADDIATLHWRTAGRQKAPVIIRTRGHRLEGVWHSGSFMGGIIHMVRGVHVAVPRDMVRAIGFYNTLLNGDDPALVVEPLLGYRKKEVVPDNWANVALPLGVPEVIRPGHDVTLVTYGAMCDIALEAAVWLAEAGIELEIIDVQTLLPFDVSGRIVKSLKKTSKIVFADEDVPGGTTAFMLQQVIEVQGGYDWLDARPRTLTAAAHRPAYGTDGGYFSKPSPRDVFELIYDLMHEVNPKRFPH